MNPIQKAIDNVKFKIPPQIMRTFFVSSNLVNRAQNINIDDNILSLVIRPRVLVDCNIVGGVEVNVDMRGIQGEIIDQLTTVYRIPKDRTQGRSIMSTLSLSYVDANSTVNWGGNLPVCGVSVVGTAHQALLNSVSPPPVTATASVRLLGDNVVEVRDATRLMGYGSLRCVIANDENMSHLQPRSYHDFAKLVEYAVKAYIYNNYVVEMDMGQLHGGQNLGTFKEVVDSFADANELYDTFLKEKFTKIQMMNDREAMVRHTKSLIGGYR